MKILACGSRTWDSDDAYKIGDALLEFRNLHPTGEFTLIHGDAPGVDREAGKIAGMLGWSVKSMPADWSREGKQAGILRNLRMLDEKPDIVLAFWDGKSRGTQHTIEQAKKRGIPVVVILRGPYSPIWPYIKPS